MYEVKFNLVREIKMITITYFIFSLFIFIIHNLENKNLVDGIQSMIIFLIIFNIIAFVIGLYEIIQDQYTANDVLLKLVSISITVFSNIFIFSYFYYINGFSSAGNIIKNDYLTSLYFSIVTWTTLGYGDLSPVGNVRFIASVEALLGQLYMALLTGLFLFAFQLKVKDK